MRSRQIFTILILLSAIIWQGNQLMAQTRFSLSACSKNIIQDTAQAKTSMIHPLLPEYARRNPLDYAPLCRFEVKIEQKLPIGIWIKADGNVYRQTVNPGLAYLRFKLPLGLR